MSAVQLAIEKAKNLSPSEAKEFLTWLDEKRAKGFMSRMNRSRAKRSRPRSIKELQKWHNSIRLTTDWEPPRMPNDLAKSTSLL